MKTLKPKQDAYGNMLYDYLKKMRVAEISERDDGYVDFSLTSVKTYFSEPDDWDPAIKNAIDKSCGKVLDIGCGAGRFSIYLQQKNIEVTGIDNSPLAIKLCKQRGVIDARCVSIESLSKKIGIYDTILMMGYNFCLFGNPRKLKSILNNIHSMTSNKARIIAQVRIPQLSNIKKQSIDPMTIRYRVRYREFATPYSDFLFISPLKLEELLEKTRWQLKEAIKDSLLSYIVTIEKK